MHEDPQVENTIHLYDYLRRDNDIKKKNKAYFCTIYGALSFTCNLKIILLFLFN